MASLDPTTIIPLCIAAYFHVIFAYRKRARWARINVDFWRRIAAKDTDAVVLVWAIGIDVIAVITMFLPP